MTDIASSLLLDSSLLTILSRISSFALVYPETLPIFDIAGHSPVKLPPIFHPSVLDDCQTRVEYTILSENTYWVVRVVSEEL